MAEGYHLKAGVFWVKYGTRNKGADALIYVFSYDDGDGGDAVHELLHKVIKNLHMLTKYCDEEHGYLDANDHAR